MKQRVSNAIYWFVRTRCPFFDPYSIWFQGWMLFVFLISYLVHWRILPQPEREIRKVDFLGTACDPFHIGHLEVLMYLLFCQGVDLIRFYPYGFAEWKDNSTPSEDRLQVMNLSIPRWMINCPFLPILKINPEDMWLEPRPTWQMYEDIKAMYPDAETVEFVTGSDAVTPSEKHNGELPIQHWKEPSKVMQIPIVALTRAGYADSVDPNLLPNTKVIKVKLTNVSSSEIRDSRSKGDNRWRKFVKPAAQRYLDKTA